VQGAGGGNRPTTVNVVFISGTNSLNT